MLRGHTRMSLECRAHSGTAKETRRILDSRCLRRECEQKCDHDHPSWQFAASRPSLPFENHRFPGLQHSLIFYSPELPSHWEWRVEARGYFIKVPTPPKIP
ncbi:hypothetical protein RvY_19183-3 [Ramazzottius varieornatus]|uniref:Uncharacterized protein n=1 Tax=Ramazzottius varieornatus TaxID=947166 RepID=A0A1D1W8K3_RAMVA|nr:hypothetical protein RvY_19183-3 [Ramazzottius varieornatus]